MERGPEEKLLVVVMLAVLIIFLLTACGSDLTQTFKKKTPPAEYVPNDNEGRYQSLLNESAALNRAKPLAGAIQVKINGELEAQKQAVESQSAAASQNVDWLEAEIKRREAERAAAQKSAEQAVPTKQETAYYGSDNWVEKAMQGCAHGPEGL